MVSSNTPQARPKALVHDDAPTSGFRLFDAAFFGLVVDGAQAQDFQLALAVGSDHGCGVADLLVEQARPMGELVEIFPAATSDSSLVTSLYSISSFLVLS